MNANTDWNTDVSILGTATFPVDGFMMVRQNGFYTSVAGDIGKTVYLGLQLEDAIVPNNAVFPRVDVVSLSVVAIPEPSTLALMGAVLLGLTIARRKVSR